MTATAKMMTGLLLFWAALAAAAASGITG